MREVARAYREALGGVDGIELPFDDAAVELSVHFAFPVLVADGETRDAVRASRHERGIQTTFYPALTQRAAYRPDSVEGARPRAEEFARRHIALPFFPALDRERIELVVSGLGEALLQ